MAPPFNPSAAASPGSGIFGLDVSPDEAAVHVLGVPFDATTSYRGGAAEGPAAILRASRQVDLFDLVTGRPYEAGIHMPPLEPRVAEWNAEATTGTVERANELGAELNAFVDERTAETLERGKLPVLVGGDHATPFGAIAACARAHPGLGVLHFDAHADLRVAYEGYTWSHASILHNVVERLDGVAQVVQVGVRDLCEDELRAIEGSDGRVRTLFDHEWAQLGLRGETKVPTVERWIDQLPSEVYVTFDVDGLDPTLCPGTGTPVPGGLSWHDAMLWLETLVRSGHTVVGCDLVEVAPSAQPDGDDSIDAIVGARLLYRLIGFARMTRA